MNTDNISSYTKNYGDYPSDPVPRTFSGGESAFAWISFICGYLFCRFYTFSARPLGAFLLTLILTAASGGFILHQKKKLSFLSCVIGISTVTLAFSMLFSQNEALCFLSRAYCIVSYIFFVYTATSNLCDAKKGIGDMLIFDFIRALFVLPMLSLGEIYRASFAKRSKGSKALLHVIIGLGVTVIPSAIIVSLLSFDKSFTDMLKSIFNFKLEQIASNFISIIFGVPVGMYIFSAYVSGIDRKASSVFNESGRKRASESLKIMPQITAAVAATPILILYVIFFISQWNTYFSAFSGVLPDNTIYSEYARSGFFELCWVSVINLILITLAGVFTKRKSENTGIIVRLLIGVMSLFTLLLISTAMSKMILYIDAFGLTPKRVYSSLFMILLAIVFVFIIIRQISRRFNLAFAIVCVSVIMLTVTAFSNIDGQIAKYNIDRSVEGTLTLDVSATFELGDAAIPYLVNYYENLPKTDPLRDEIYNRLSVYANKDKIGLFEFTFTHKKAERALEELFGK